MTMDTNAALEDLFDSFRQGDHGRMALRYHDDIDWLMHAPIFAFPFAGRRRGKAEVFKSFAQLYDVYRIVEYNLEKKIVEGDRAATLSQVHLVQRSTDRSIRAQIASFHLFRNGQVIEYRGFTDSFDVVEQALGRELEIGT